LRRIVALLVLAAAALAAHAQSEIGLWLGRSSDADETDVVRLIYRRALKVEGRAWWWPQYLQLGAGVWRIPDLTGPTRRTDVSITPVWRLEGAHGYVEGGFGAYVLSKTVNNDTTSLPTSFQFGSHVGAGVALKNAGVGVAFQHLSNAGIKQPNGGINFYLATVSLEL
jgi:lipid A 3-O-deacylase